MWDAAGVLAPGEVVGVGAKGMERRLLRGKAPPAPDADI
jgi:hypothetical protein